MAQDGGRPTTRRALAEQLCMAASSQLIVMQNRKEAIATYEKATQVDPDYSQAWDMLGRLYGTDNRVDDAEMAFQRALRAANEDESRASAIEGLGLIARKRKDAHAADRHFRIALAMFDQLGLTDKLDRVWESYPSEMRTAHRSGNFQHALLPKMVVIQPGKYLMGAHEREASLDKTGRQQPLHEVQIAYLFAIGKYSVTFAEWDSALRAGSSKWQPGDADWGRDRRPVVNVSWDDTQEYIGWLNAYLGLADRSDCYRLPSEAEWEYACRAGSAEYPIDGGRDGQRTQPVTSFGENAFGLCGMLGNIWEHVEDSWSDDYSGTPIDGSAWLDEDEDRHVTRGGDFHVSRQFLTPGLRNRLGADERIPTQGFRLARTLRV